jgi:autotransporter translocation and assembly factor TamB
MTQRWLRRLGFALLVAAVVIVGGALALSAAVRAWGPEFTRERVEAALSDALDQPVRVGEVRLRPWRGRLSLSEVVSDGGPDGVALRIPLVNVDAALESLWRRRLVLSITLSDLDVRVARRFDGPGRAAPFPLPDGFAVGPLRVVIGSLRIIRGHALVLEPGRQLGLELRVADAYARPIGGDLDVSLQVQELAIERGGFSVDVDTVGLDARLSADAIQLRRLSWRWRRETVHLQGAVRAPWADAAELAVRVTGAVPFGARDGAGGVARVTAEVTGPLTSPRVKGRVSVTALRTGKMDASLSASVAPDGVARVAMDLREVTLPGSLGGLGPGVGALEATIDRGQVELRRGHVAWRAATLDAAGRIDTAGPLAVTARLAADLRDAGRAMGAGDLGGRASLSAEISGTFSAPELTGRTVVTGLTVGGQSVDPAEASFRFTAASDGAHRWDGTIHAARIGWRPAPIDELLARLTVDGTRLEVVNARARVAMVPVEAASVWEWAGSGRARATLGPATLGTLSLVPATIGLGGTARGQLDATIRQGVLDTIGAIQLERVSVTGLGLGDGTLGVRTRGRALQAELAFPSRALRVEASGPLRPGSTIAAQIALDALALRPLLADLRSPAADHVDGRVSARGELTIPFDDPARARGLLRVQPEGLRLLGEPWTSRGPITIAWQGDRARVDQLRLDGPAGTLTASGALGGPEAETFVVALDNARLPGALTRLGRGAARAEIRLVRSGLEVARLDARWPGLVASATGHVRDGTVALDATADGDLARLPLDGLDGKASLSLRVRGAVDAPQATGRLHAPRVQASGVVLTDVGIPLRFSPNVLSVEDGHALLGTKRISLTGRAAWSGPDTPPASALAREPRLTADVRAPSVPLEALAPLLPAALHGRGDLALAARVEGTPSRWRGGGTLSSATADLAIGPLRQVRVPFTLDESGIDVQELRADLDSVAVRGSATWRWAGSGRTELTLGPAELRNVTRLPPGLAARGSARATLRATVGPSADLEGEALATFDGVSLGGAPLGRGRIDVSVRDRGFRAALDFPEARIGAAARGQMNARHELRAQLDPVRFTLGGDAWNNRAPIEITWSADGVRLANVDLAGGGGGVTARASVTTSGALDARLEGRVPLTMLPTFRPEIEEAGGTLEITARASGTTAAPALTGDGAIHKGSILLRDRPEALRDLEARFTLSNQGLQLREATGTFAGGRVQARGDASLAGWRLGPYRGRVTARGVSPAILDGLSAAWDADLELAGAGAEARLRGDLTLVRGVYTKDLSLIPLLLASRREAAAEEGGSPLRLSLRVRIDDSLAVRTRTVDLRASGRLAVEGTVARPAISGSVTSRDGRVLFRNQDWTVTTASVRFTDPRRIDPYVDVIAECRIREYDVVLHVSGPASKVAVEMTSVPRLARDDLLALVAFGSTRAELRDAPGAALLGEAGRIIARDLLGIDAASAGLRVTSGAASDSPLAPHAWAGEDPTRVDPSRNSPNDRKQKVRIEYRLLDPLFLSSEYDLDGGYGADLILRLRFR